jgi:DNA modification methylase
MSVVRLIEGSMLERLADLDPNHIDACVTDPPYELGFMGRQWDSTGIAFQPDTWSAVHRVLKPGAHLLAFGGTKGFHRMACAIEDAGFEIRDTMMWVYGSGFPKSHNISKAIDRHLGAQRPVLGLAKGAGSSETESLGVFAPSYEITAPASPEARQWAGWGTALKPAYEPIIVARKIVTSTVAINVLEYGTGALNIDGCRVDTTENLNGGAYAKSGGRGRLTGDYRSYTDKSMFQAEFIQPAGRWPANLIHDGSDDVLDCFPDTNSGSFPASRGPGGIGQNGHQGQTDLEPRRTDAGSAARFFYSAKASKTDREPGNDHPTVKPTALMRYLCRLVTPPGGTIVDPFMGSGSTGKGAVLEGFGFTGIELDPHYLEIAERRIRGAMPDKVTVNDSA